MGSITTALQNMSGANEDEQRQKERLQILLMAAKARIQTFRDEINENFLNPGQIDKKQIPGIRAIRFIEQYHVAVRSSFNQQVGEHLGKAINAFFAIGDGNNKEAVKMGIKELIAGSLEAFIGSTAAGESEQRVYVVIPENNAFVRVDIACWKYNFEQTKIIAQSDSAVAYVLCKSVIDHTTLTLDEIIYLTSDAMSTGGFRTTPNTTGLDPATTPAASARLKPKTPAELMQALKTMGYKDDLAASLASDLATSDLVKVYSPLLLADTLQSYENLRDKAIAGVLLSVTKAPASLTAAAPASPPDAKPGRPASGKGSALAPEGEAGHPAENRLGENDPLAPPLLLGDDSLHTSAKYSLPKLKDSLEDMGEDATSKQGGARRAPSLTSVEAYLEEMITVWKKLKMERKEA